MDGMKKYRIIVSHTATAEVEHVVEAKNMQDAMFKLGRSMDESPGPFDGVDHEYELDIISVSAPVIMDDQQ